MKEFMCPDGTMSVNQICRMFMSKADRDRLAGIVPKPDESLVTGTKNIVESIERGAGTDIKNIPIPKKTFDQKYESIEDIPITPGISPKTDTSLKSPKIIDTKSLVDQYKAKEISSSPIDRVIDTVSNTISPMVDKVTQPVKDMVSKVPKGFDFDFEQIKETKQTADNIISANTDYYNNYVEDNFGIPTNVQTGLRVASSLYGFASGGGIAAAAGPFALPIILGGAIKSADNRRIENITMQDTQGALNQITSPRIMNIQPTAQDIYRGGGGDRPSPSPARTSQGVTSAQHQAFRL
jgi:hypothetical protein